MTISPHIAPATTAAPYGSQELARSIAEALLIAHAASPFADATAVSAYLHRVHGNPRITITTTERGDRITVRAKQRGTNTTILTLSIH